MNPVALWNRFWFTPESAVRIAAVRVALGVTCLCWALSILPDVATFYFDDRILPAASYADHRVGLFQWVEGDWFVIVVFGTFVAASLALVAGRAVRVAAPLLWLTFVSLQQEATAVLNAGDLLLRIWTAYFALFALVTPERLLATPLLGNRAADRSRSWPLAPVWILRIFQIQLSVVYIATVIEKLPGSTWRNGTAALYALGLVDFERFWVPHAVRESLWVGGLFTWITLGLEITLPLLLWLPWTRRFAIVAGMGMHVGFDYTMRLGFFLWAMAIGYLTFLRAGELERAMRWVHRKLDRSGAAGVPPPAGGVGRDGDVPAEAAGDDAGPPVLVRL